MNKIDFIVRKGQVDLSRNSRLKVNAFECILAVVSIVSSSLYLTIPAVFEHAAIREELGLFAYVWLLFYALSGGLIIGGIFSFKRNVEVAGLILFSIAILINAVALLDFYGLKLLITIAMHLGVVLTCFARIWIITKGEYAAIIKLKEEVD